MKKCKYKKCNKSVLRYKEGRLFCSRECFNLFKIESPTFLKGENNYQWQFKNVSYGAIHRWLNKHFGKPNKCENSNCINKSKIYEWAKLKEKNYERKRENFQTLCRSCHRKHDFNKKLWQEKRVGFRTGNKLGIKPKTGKFMKCPICINPFYVPKNELNRRKTCSKKCFSIYLKNNWKLLFGHRNIK